MEAIRLEKIVEKDGELWLRGLPCKRDQKVEVIILIERPAAGEGEAPPEEDARPTVWRKLVGLGTGLDLPQDLAEQHDHYAHGTPRR